MKKVAVLAMLLIAGSMLAQSTSDGSQHVRQAEEGQIVVQGCVSHSSTRNILMQSTGNSYVLEETGKVIVDDYLGQQAEVTGSESPTFSTSSTPSMSGAGIPPVTILVESIRTVSKQCTF